MRDAGADVVVDRHDVLVAAQLGDLVPEGLDAVADVVGGPLVGTAMPHLRAGGRWVVSGAVSGLVVELDLRRLYLRSVSLLGSMMHSPAQFEVLVATANAGHVRPVVAQVFPLEDAAQAQAQLERREHVGKLVLLPRGT